jgi:hypothetical protein
MVASVRALFEPLQYRAPARIQAHMLALTDSQLAAVMVAARGLPVEKRDLFLTRIAAKLKLRGANLTDADFERAVQLALTGLIHSAA